MAGLVKRPAAPARGLRDRRVRGRGSRTRGESQRALGVADECTKLTCFSSVSSSQPALPPTTCTKTGTRGASPSSSSRCRRQARQGERNGGAERPRARSEAQARGPCPCRSVWIALTPAAGVTGFSCPRSTPSAAAHHQLGRSLEPRSVPGGCTGGRLISKFSTEYGMIACPGSARGHPTVRFEGEADCIPETHLRKVLDLFSNDSGACCSNTRRVPA